MPISSLPTPLGTLKVSEEAGRIVDLSWDTEPAHDTSPLINHTATQLAEYFAGTRQVFDLPLNLKGTPFQKAVWAEMCKIPYGETRTYGDLAKALRSSPRAVGGACGANPIPVIVPCHRVVGAGGKLTGYSGGMGVHTKALLLAFEQNAARVSPAHFALWRPWRQHLPRVPFYLMRHGETAYNLENRLQGQTDIPLNDTGRAQAHAAGAQLKALAPRRVVSSTLGRAAETARLALEASGLKGVTLSQHPGLVERGFGRYEGNKRDANPHYHPWLCPADGEGRSAFVYRLLSTLPGLLAGEGPVLLVAHGAVIRALDEVLGMSTNPSIKNCAIYEVLPPAGADDAPWRFTLFEPQTTEHEQTPLERIA